MSFWDKVKAQVKKDVQNAKDSAHIKEIKLEYIGGMPGVKGDEIKLAKHGQTGATWINGTEVKLLEIDWQESGKRSGGKAAAGAIVGTVLAPGIGTIAGAAMGGRRKDTSTAVIALEAQGQTYSVYVRCTAAEFKELSLHL
ncbi:hypothetical protein [Paenibacillus agilis]|uniref:Uncharacterized protein n=1 Tax=Paenibacillus agilis TaxID=3020863 RepID=A0A559IX81_9BACL|nr:hypothetical protein [Paenibacillus agilis]TVX92244.1 hypothetical protein FPZ44_03715 [Paenibacillus agilis]